MNTVFRRRSPLRARVLAGGLLLAAIGTVAAVPAASALPISPASPVSAARAGQPASGTPVGLVSWSVEPASATAPDARTRYSYQNIKPGTTIFDHVAVFNRSSQAVAFSIYATDATGTSADGALTLLAGNQHPKNIGAWTTFPGHRSQLSIIIGGGKGIIEPFTITVPTHATPGDHIGGMIAAVGVPHRTANGTLVELFERIAVPMDLRVTGKLVAALTISSVSVGLSTPFNPFGGGAAHVTYTVTNTGNVILAGTQTVTVSGTFGGTSTVHAPALVDVLPGDSLRYSLPAGHVYPAGSVSAHVTVTPRWPSDATPLAVTLAAASASASTFALPWALLVLILLLAGGGFAVWRLTRSRRRAHQAEIAAAAEKARRDTERRLLGDAHGKPPAKSATSGKTSAQPGTSGKTSPAPAPDATPVPGANGQPTHPSGANGKPTTAPGANGKASTAPGTNGTASTAPGSASKNLVTPGSNGKTSTTLGPNRTTTRASGSGKTSTTLGRPPASTSRTSAAPAAPAAPDPTPESAASEPSANPAAETTTTNSTVTPGGAGQPG
jgi:hypothetical protein